MSTVRRSARLETLRPSYQTRSKTSAAASVLHGSTKRAREQSSHQRPKRANVQQRTSLMEQEGRESDPWLEAGDKLQGDHPQTLTPSTKESCVGESCPNSHPRGDEKEGQPRKGITKGDIERKYLMLRQKYCWSYDPISDTDSEDEEDDLEAPKENIQTENKEEDDAYLTEEDDLEAPKENEETENKEEDDAYLTEEDDALGTEEENVENNEKGEKEMDDLEAPKENGETEKQGDEGEQPKENVENEKGKKVPDEGQQPESVPEEHSGTTDTKHSIPEQQQEDDGSRRCTLQDPLKYFVAEVMEGIDEKEDCQLHHGRNRKRKASSRAERKGRGLANPREEAPFEDRPRLIVVGDGEFTSKPICSKIITTIRLLTLWNMPGPYRTYKAFPFETRLSIARQFLRRYRWEEGQNLGRCLEVFEFIADGVYCRELTDVRRNMKKKLGNNAVAWVDKPPAWCRNNEYWKGLCQIWATKKWIKQSDRNHANRTKNGRIVYHVGGAKSTYKHKQALVNSYHYLNIDHEKLPLLHYKTMKTQVVFSLCPVNKRNSSTPSNSTSLSRENKK